MLCELALPTIYVHPRFSTNSVLNQRDFAGTPSANHVILLTCTRTCAKLVRPIRWTLASPDSNLENFHLARFSLVNSSFYFLCLPFLESGFKLQTQAHIVAWQCHLEPFFQTFLSLSFFRTSLIQLCFVFPAQDSVWRLPAYWPLMRASALLEFTVTRLKTFPDSSWNPAWKVTTHKLSATIKDLQSPLKIPIPNKYWLMDSKRMDSSLKTRSRVE